MYICEEIFIDNDTKIEQAVRLKCEMASFSIDAIIVAYVIDLFPLACLSAKKYHSDYL